MRRTESIRELRSRLPQIAHQTMHTQLPRYSADRPHAELVLAANLFIPLHFGSPVQPCPPPRGRPETEYLVFVFIGGAKSGFRKGPTQSTEIIYLAYETSSLGCDVLHDVEAPVSKRSGHELASTPDVFRSGRRSEKLGQPPHLSFSLMHILPYATFAGCKIGDLDT